MQCVCVWGGGVCVWYWYKSHQLRASHIKTKSKWRENKKCPGALYLKKKSDKVSQITPLNKKVNNPNYLCQVRWTIKQTCRKTKLSVLIISKISLWLLMQDTRVRSLGQEDPLEEEMALHSSTLAWRIPWREEPGRLQSMGSQRVGHDWVTSLSFSFFFS